ncbi:MAG: hypothetical protein QW701_02995 [Candidatus Nezhaarchaeales archaeon]
MLGRDHNYKVGSFKNYQSPDFPLFKVDGEKCFVKFKCRLQSDAKAINDFINAMINGSPEGQLLVAYEGNEVQLYGIIVLKEEVKNVEELLQKCNFNDTGIVVECISSAAYLGDDFPLTVDGHRVVVFLREFVQELTDHFVNYLGSGGAALLWHLGKKWGERMVAKAYQKITIPSVEERLRILFDTLRAMGWGTFNLKDIETISRKGTIVVENSCEQKGNGCHLMRGLLAGILSEVFGENVNVREVSHNNHGKCNFVFFYGSDSVR